MKKKNKKNNIIFRFFKSLILLVVLIVLSVALINGYMIFSNKDRIIDGKEISKKELETIKSQNAEYIIIPGASVLPSGKPSGMLKSRLDLASEIYFSGGAKKILITGDSRVANYDEVGSMRNYLMQKGIPLQDITEDTLGISTKESIARAKNVYKIENAIIVSQEFHIYRGIYICDFFDISAIGVHTGKVDNIEKREVLARVKEFTIIEIERISNLF